MVESSEVPKVFVLILNYNGIDLLEESCASYLANDYPNFKVVVIDNGSSDESVQFVKKRFPEIVLIEILKNLGYSGGFNVGLEFAFKKQDVDYVLITNNDVKADSNVIEELVKIGQSAEDIGFVTGKVYYYDSPNEFQTVGKSADKKYWRHKHIGVGQKDNGQYDFVRELDWCDDIFWLVKKELYLKTGGYDTEFKFQAEDFDWQVRAKLNGFKLFYTPHAKIWHKDSVTIGKDTPMKSFYNYRNPTIVHMKYRTWEQYKAYFFRKFKSLIILTLKNLFKLRLYYIWKSWQGYFSAIVWGKKNKRFYFYFLFRR